HVADRYSADALHFAAECADDSGRQCLIEPERISDRDGLLADLDAAALVRKGNGGHGFSRCVDVQDGDVFLRLPTDDAGLEALMILQRDRERARVFYDVKVRDDVAIRLPNESGARHSR